MTTFSGRRLLALAATLWVVSALFASQSVEAGRYGAWKSQTLAISGSAASSVIAGSPYSFKPTLSSGAVKPVFSIANKPTWASFSLATGSLAGTPATSNLATTGNIVISAIDGLSSASLAPFSISVLASPAPVVSATSGSATLSWLPPTQNTDGSSLSNLAGCNLYYGTSATALSNKVVVSNAGLTSYFVDNLAAGTYYFWITAYSGAGTESALSTVGSKRVL